MKPNPRAFSENLHAVEHDERAGCSHKPACQPVADTVTVAVPATGVVVVENGVVLDTAKHHTMRRLQGNHWRFELEAKRPTPFFETGKKYKLDGRDKWFTVSYVDIHPVTGEPYAHGWFREEWPGGDAITFAGASRSATGWWEV